jgi:AcrR family transcriptional regulator
MGQIHVINSDMNDQPTASRYHSPLRDRQKQQTRDLILDAVAVILRRANLEDVTVTEVARTAEITERTVYRHFATREELLTAFWRRALRAFIRGQTGDLASLDEFFDLTRATFRRFEENEGVIRAIAGSAEGREVRKKPNEQRLETLTRLFAGLLPDLPPEQTRMIAVAAHALASASGWSHMRDFCGVRGEDAADAVTFAIGLMTEAAAQRGGRRASRTP